MNKSLLIIPCSPRKVRVYGTLPAWKLYKSKGKSIIDKARREGTGRDCDVLILSARFGIVTPATRLPYYDQKMTPGRAREINADVIKTLRSFVKENQPIDVYCWLGATYRKALEPVNEWAGDITVSFASGNIMQRMHQLKEWITK